MTDEDEVLSELRRFVAAASDRGLGTVELASNAAAFDFDRSLNEAARNLLTKAMKAVVEEDQAKTTRLIRRSLDLPPDERDGIPRAVRSAHQLLFNTVTDALEDTLEEVEDEWLEACLTVAFDALNKRLALGDRVVSDEDARVIGLQFGVLLSEITTDYYLPPSWRERTTSAKTWLPEPAEDVFDISPDTDPEHWIKASLLAVAPFDRAYDEMI